ncbi:large proline-rich protein BAG6 isoform X11 [Drosophila takahashii]|uniref:large proline-rich protein BAG6 isoform X11 n=1 Tax=Drosophila takahashii TaxID=29030 RepID=UPI001CF8EC9B|nr:large proline-rich protein BAG6 isoform X6 [Drosophila takahashii]
MLINLKVKTLDARTHEFSIDNELTIRQFKDQIAEKTNIAAENQRIIYQGRVLADEKQVKEYDVDGKVLHVAERPPFSQRGANSRNNDEPMRPFRNVARPPPPGMRTSPYFRALDGMLVGTMAIPVNNGPVAGTRPTPNRYPNSSSFCINRITVALHMIDCADNIAAYLENPAVGLNNQSLDILQRGRWSMESTVVEVGVSSTDLPRNNNIIDMVQDAVTAALSRTGARNYTVVQLPTVYTNENGETSQQRTGEAGTSEGAGAAGAASDASGETTAATVIIEDVIETDDEAADGASDRSATPTPEPEAEGAVGGQPVAAAETPSSSNGAANDAAAGGEGGNNSGPRRRTRPQVLAQVIQHYRGVQTRLAPFVDRYYEILQNDPTFEESDTAGRENAQRIFDRVSEAFHYLSHAQHAISDLMLDLSQPGPRVLTCRPILVEQSGYIRSNNIFTPNFLAPPPGLLNEPFRGRAPGSAAAAGTQTPTTAGTPSAVGPPQASNLQAATDASRSAAAMAEIASRAAGAAAEMAAGAASAAAAAARGLASDHVEDPVDEPMVAPNAAIGTPQGQQQPRLEMDHDHDQDQNETPEREMRAAPRLRVYVPVTLPPPNPQLEMARSILAMVNGQRPNDVHVEFNAPNVMSINLPVHVMTAVRQAPAPGAQATETAAPSAPTEESSPESAPAAGDSPNAASTSSGTRSADQRANTLPTTSTQTRSTSRPQIQIGGNNNWGGRIAPTHTAFDRFLPCNSHHIREPEPLPHSNNASGASANRGTGTAAVGGAAAVVSPTAAVGTRPASAGSAVATAAVGASSTTSSGEAATAASTTSSAPPQAVLSTATPSPGGGDSGNLRSQLRSFLNDSLFVGVPINEQTIPGAIGRALEWFGESLVYLPQYERPEYNSRDSVCNILRVSLRLIIELCSAAPGGSDGAQFEQSLKQICDQFRKRLYSVLFLCLGSANAELYWRQLMRLLCAPMRSNFQNEALQFLCIYIDPTIPAQTDTVDAQQFLVLRSVQAAPPTDAAEQQPQQQTLDTDVEMAEVATSSSSSSTPAEAQLPAVLVGSEPWHMSFPNDWLPVITRDLQTQTEQNGRPQPPFSDAYISGMSAKRRKIIQSEKPTASVECLIANGVQRAIQSAGLGGTSGSASSSSISVDAVIGSIAHDSAIQASYTDAVRNSVKERIKQDADFKSSKYPQIAKFAEQK